MHTRTHKLKQTTGETQNQRWYAYIYIMGKANAADSWSFNSFVVSQRNWSLYNCYHHYSRCFIICHRTSQRMRHTGTVIFTLRLKNYIGSYSITLNVLSPLLGNATVSAARLIHACIEVVCQDQMTNTFSNGTHWSEERLWNTTAVYSSAGVSKPE